MTDHIRTERELLVALFAEWLADRTGQPCDGIEAEGEVHFLTCAAQRVAYAVETLATGAVPAGWSAQIDAFSARVRLPDRGGVIVWVPAGAAMPEAEPATSAVSASLSEAIDDLAPGDAIDAALPIEIHLRKRDDAGAYVSAYGGLAGHWARFTDRVSGYFQIDATALHRLPADEAVVIGLVDEIVAASAGLALDDMATVSAFDYWRVQRLQAGAGGALIALPADDTSESGAALRKRLRTMLRDRGAQLRAHAADARILVLYGHYPSLDEEPVGAALRGQDPALFGGLDMVVLLADGQIRPLIDVTRKAWLQTRAASPDETS